MNKIYKSSMALAVFLIMLMAQHVKAQTNLAPSAVVSAFTTDPNGLWNWNQINNNSFSSCGNQEAFIWTSTNGIQGNEHMTWTWSSAKSINKIRFHNAWNNTRNLTAGDVYYYNGSSYVFWKTISIAQACVDSASFPTVTTTSLRITNFKMTGGGQTSNPSWREIEVISGPSVNNDAGATSFGNLTLCDLTQILSVRVTNMGKKTLDSFRLHWSINGTFQGTKYIPSKLGTGRDTSIVLNSSFSLNRSTNYTFKAWTSMPNGTSDSIAANDTVNRLLKFIGFPVAPTTVDRFQCGGGKALLEAIPNSPSDSISWYDAPTGGNFIGLGKKIYSPFIKGTTKFYAQVGGGARFTVDNGGFTGGTIVSASTALFNGTYFNITPSKTIFLDSLLIRFWNNSVPGYRLYYKTGTHVGSETNSSAWTLLTAERGRLFTNSGKYMARCNATSVQLNANQIYGFYFTTDPGLAGNDFYLTNGTNPKTNADVSFSGSVVVNSLFGSTGLYTTWMVDLELMYGFAPLSPCISNSPRVPVTITVKPTPIGAELVKGATFQGQWQVGDFTKPDITEAGKTIQYELSPPTGFNNADNGNTWLFNGVTAYTRYGVLVPSTAYSVTAPSSSGAGVITFTPGSQYIDSFITFNTRFSDLGPYFCDSTVKRTVLVAPTPWPSFKFPVSICLGDAILFDNTTTIRSGNFTSTWYFGDGDSSDLQSPVHEYKNSGSYQVKLRVKSYPWNVLHDTTITVEVGELPLVKFRVNNKCQGVAVTFQNQTTVGNGALTYEWDFGDNTAKSSITNPSHLYNAPGGYKVTLKASANGCVATLVKNAYTFARPVANFAAPLAPVCAGTEVNMPNTSTIMLGEQGAYWRFGDGASSTQFHGLHTYSAPGSFTVKLLAVSEFDCKDSISKNVVIKPTPSPDFTGNQFCGKIPTVFTNTTVEDLPSPVYNWYFSDGITSTQKNFTRSWPYEGPFSVKLEATYSNGCKAEITKNVVVLIQPKANFSVQDICSGESASFVNLSSGDRGNINYNWDFGNGTYSTIAAPVRLYNPGSTTTYTVSLVASYTGGCSDTARKTITVSESPTCDFTYKENGFLNSTFTPSNTSYSKYEWFFGEGGTSTQTSPTYKYLYTGNFNVTMRATNAAGCECEITKRVSTTTDLNSIHSDNGINIYPNPNSGIFTVSNNSGSSMKVEVFNVLGEKILSKTVDGNLVVNLDSHAKGIYLVKVTVNGVTTTTRITVNN